MRLVFDCDMSQGALFSACNRRAGQIQHTAATSRGALRQNFFERTPRRAARWRHAFGKPVGEVRRQAGALCSACGRRRRADQAHRRHKQERFAPELFFRAEDATSCREALGECPDTIIGCGLHRPCRLRMPSHLGPAAGCGSRLRTQAQDNDNGPGCQCRRTHHLRMTMMPSHLDLVFGNCCWGCRPTLALPLASNAVPP